MTKDKYGLFGRKKTTVPQGLTSYKFKKPVKVCAPAPAASAPPLPIFYKAPPKTVLKCVPVPQLISNSYAPPTLPKVCEAPLSGQGLNILTPQLKPRVATSADGFFKNIFGLSSKPLLRIPEKPAPPPAPEPVPGSREAKLRKFITTHF